MPQTIGRNDWNYTPSLRERTAFHEAGHCVALFHVGFDLSSASVRRRKSVLGWVRMSRTACGRRMDELGMTKRGRRQLAELEVAVSLGGILAEDMRGKWHHAVLPPGLTNDGLIEMYGATADWARAREYMGLLLEPARDMRPDDPESDRVDRLLWSRLDPLMVRLFRHNQYKAGTIAVARALLAKETLSSSQVRKILQKEMARHGGPPPGHDALRLLVEKARAQRERRRKGRPTDH